MSGTESGAAPSTRMHAATAVTARRIVGGEMETGERLTATHLVAQPALHHQTDARIDHVLLGGATSTDPHHQLAKPERVDRPDPAILFGRHVANDGRPRQPVLPLTRRGCPRWRWRC